MPEKSSLRNLAKYGNIKLNYKYNNQAFYYEDKESHVLYISGKKIAEYYPKSV